MGSRRWSWAHEEPAPRGSPADGEHRALCPGQKLRPRQGRCQGKEPSETLAPRTQQLFLAAELDKGLQPLVSEKLGLFKAFFFHLQNMFCHSIRATYFCSVPAQVDVLCFPERRGLEEVCPRLFNPGQARRAAVSGSEGPRRRKIRQVRAAAEGCAGCRLGEEEEEEEDRCLLACSLTRCSIRPRAWG